MNEAEEMVEIDDPLYQKTVDLLGGFGRFRTARLQQVYCIGWNRASRIMDRLKAAGLIVLVDEDRGYYEAAPAPQGLTGQGEGAAASIPLDLVALARETGLRSFLQGVNATDARVLLGRFVSAVDAARAAGATDDAVLAQAKRLHAAAALAADPQSPASWDSLCGPAQSQWVLRVPR